MDLGERIKRWRKARGLTRRQLADLLGVTAAAVHQWESTGPDRTLPLARRLPDIAKVFGLSIGEFYGAIPKPRRAA